MKLITKSVGFMATTLIALIASGLYGNLTLTIALGFMYLAGSIDMASLFTREERLKHLDDFKGEA